MSADQTPDSPAESRQVLSDRHKEAVRAWVPKLRELLENEFDAQLERLGLKRSGKHKPVEEMRLPQQAVAARRRLEALVARDSAVEGTPARGYENVKRELAYTLLNRLVGLKAMEARHLLYLPPPEDPTRVPEETQVLTPIEGQARSRYLRDFRAAGGDRYKYTDDAEESLLRDALSSAFCFVTSEIRILFDPEHEYACIWPSYGALTAAIRMINDDLPADAYGAADFLGWVYQFFNRDEKKRVREENKGTPRSSYELAVINQFYTPSWVVKVLVDNTLGRLWLQMHPDSALASSGPPPLPEERVSDKPVADYLIPRTGEKLRYRRVTDEAQVEEFKLARDITLLDPACGTMHFGQYAFGLFHEMYLDEIEHAGQEGWPAKPSVRDTRDIPTAILDNNLFGVDIDPRAIQIASLSLLLTAKEAVLADGFSPLDVKIRRTNLVVANAVNLGGERLRTLVDEVAALGTAELRERLFKTIWENLQHVGELGSLVQVHESVDRVLQDWVEERAREKGLTDAGIRAPDSPVFPEFDADRAGQLRLAREPLQREARELRQELLEAVETAAAEATADAAERLFAEDTARGLKLLQILSRRYDVIVMNPPYGAFVPVVKAFVKDAYKFTSNDTYAAFVERATQLVNREGYIGALTSSTFVNLSTFEKLRTEILLKRNPLIAMLDLGFGILDDATVQAAAIVLRGGTQ